MKSLTGFFNSVKLAIFLLIIITIVTILGTFIPQGRSAAEYAARYGQLSEFLITLQFTGLYHSWWFITLLFLFSLNIIVCTLTRLSPKLRKALNPKIDFLAKNITTLKINKKFKNDLRIAQTKEELKKELSSKHYRLRESEKEGKYFLLARKRVLGWFGVDFVHLGLLVIIAGGIVSGLVGFGEDITLSEGQTVPVLRADFKLKLDKFETEYHPNGAVKDWKSTVSVIENEKTLFNKIVEVNHPLTYKGYAFYQTSYGWNWENPSLEVWVKKKEVPTFEDKLKLQIGQKVKLKDGTIDVTALRFVPDFVIDQNVGATTRSLEPNNPAAYIEGWQGEEKVFSGWIFAKFPDFSQIHSEKETDLTFELKDFKGKEYSVLRAAKDPGANIIWVGCALLMLGLVLAFYWPTREIKVILDESQGKTEIIAGGIVSKNKEAFQQEFINIINSIRRSK